MLQLTLWTANIALVWLILWRGVRQGMATEHRSFYAYALYLGIASPLRLGVYASAGFSSPEYYWVANVTNLGYPIFHCAILWSIYLKIQSGKATLKQVVSVLGLASLLSAPILANLPSLSGEPFNLFHAVTLPIQALLCAMLATALINRPEIQLGENLSGIFFGLSSLIILQSIHHYNYLFAIIPFDVFRHILPLTYTLILGYFLLRLWAPSRMTVMEERRQLNLNLQLAIRQLLRSLIAR